MKPFDLEAALRGEPVSTRNGCEVKIAGYNPDAECWFRLCGWANGKLYSWNESGGHFTTQGSCCDLFMAPKEHKEWVVRTPVFVNMNVNGQPYSSNLFGPFASFDIAEKTASDLRGTIHEITVTE